VDQVPVGCATLETGAPATHASMRLDPSRPGSPGLGMESFSILAPAGNIRRRMPFSPDVTTVPLRSMANRTDHKTAPLEFFIPHFRSATAPRTVKVELLMSWAQEVAGWVCQAVAAQGQLRPGGTRSDTDLEGTARGQTHWSSRELAKTTGLSRMTVSREWRAFGLRPHRSDTCT
jgi:hypothetical protein